LGHLRLARHAATHVAGEFVVRYSWKDARFAARTHVSASAFLAVCRRSSRSTRMNVRWMAVLTGFVVDIAISALLSLLATPQFYTAPNVAQPGDLLLIGLLALSTGIGGFVAGRMAGDSRTIN